MAVLAELIFDDRPHAGPEIAEQLAPDKALALGVRTVTFGCRGSVQSSRAAILRRRLR
jgi:hypothetical protein